MTPPDAGISIGASETSEMFGSEAGGQHRCAYDDGLTILALGVDVAKAVGLPGGPNNVSARQIHGLALSAGTADQDRLGVRIGNKLVVDARTNVTF